LLAAVVGHEDSPGIADDKRSVDREHSAIVKLRVDQGGNRFGSLGVGSLRICSLGVRAYGDLSKPLGPEQQCAT
jgi:hypothetical protein